MSVSSISPRTDVSGGKPGRSPRRVRQIPEGAIAVRPKQAADLIGVGPTKMAELIREGLVESRLVGKTRLITMRSLQALAHGEEAEEGAE
jgi:hypothetical protein